MANCINILAPEFQALKQKSGLSGLILKAFVASYLSKHDGRFPELDELPGANSEPYIRLYLQVRTVGESDYVNNEEVLATTGTNSITEALAKINNEFRDREVTITEYGESSKINIRPRPTNDTLTTEHVHFATSYNADESIRILNSMLDRVALVYGLLFKVINNEELAKPEWQGVALQAKSSKAFVYNGDIYINTDKATIDSPIHEMLHIVMGATRFTDPNLYSEILLLVESNTDITKYKELYLDRTRLDIVEELLVNEFGKYLVGLKSMFDKVPRDILYQVKYNIQRTLDSMLRGTLSVKMLEDADLYNNSLVQLGGIVSSSEFTNTYQGTLDLASLHRKLSNMKTDLMKKGELKELCL